MRVLAAVVLVVLLAACGLEASDTGKEAFCGGMDDLANRIAAGEVDQEEVRFEIASLVLEGQESPDKDFVEDIVAFGDMEALPSAEVMGDIGDACADYADLDDVF